jgi:hypothetical protein
MSSFVDKARMEYDELGFDTIPLIPGSKKPFAYGWQNRPVYRLWRNAPEDANIGIRGGGRRKAAIIDCDSLATFENSTRWLLGLGYQPGDYPIVRTASGKWHIYTTFDGALPGQWRLLSKDFGKGEFRYGAGSQVAAPPSVLANGGFYSLSSGNFARLPRLARDDVLPILGNKEITVKPKLIIPRLAHAILQGKELERYRSRSEAEQAALVLLINAGFEFAEVLKLFDHSTGLGKYAELKTKNAKNAERWLKHSYDEAKQWATTHESKARQTAQAAIDWASSLAWAGTTGMYDQAAFIAAATISFKAGKFEFSAACRDVAILARIGRTSAANALYRLVENYHLLARVRDWQGNCSHVYRLTVDDTKLGHPLSTPNVRKCPSFADHDAFRKGRGKNGLGKSAGLVYQALRDSESLTVDDLAGQTGRDKRTVNRVLERMSKITDRKTGEIINMVASDDGENWKAQPVDLDTVALIVGTAGATERQKKLHERERQEHADSLLMGQKTNENDPQSGDDKKV